MCFLKFVFPFFLQKKKQTLAVHHWQKMCSEIFFSFSFFFCARRKSDFAFLISTSVCMNFGSVRCFALLAFLSVKHPNHLVEQNNSVHPVFEEFRHV